MNHVWAVAWRAPCAGLRCTETSTFSAPNASFASNIARIALGSRVQLPKQYSILSKPFRRKKYWARGLGTRTTRHGIASFTVRDWGRPQYRSTTAAFSTENRPHDGLPDDFDRREGVRFRTEDLTEKEITSIFGPEIDIERGNRMLRVIHGQRLSGTLDELIMIPHPTAYSNDLMTTGLVWLRAHYPVDEDAAIMARIEKEERVHEERLMADAERLGIYKPQAGVDKNNVHGKSGLDAIREHYERQEVGEYKPQADDIRSNTGELQPVDRKVELSARPRSDWLKYWADRAVIYAGKEAPTMSIWKRLWPSALVTSVVVGLSVLLAQNYVPPTRAARIWPDMPPAAATIITLASVNFAVLLLWKFPPAWRALNTYFLSVPGYPSALSVLGNVFSHQQTKHLFGNMLVLWFIGTRLHDDIGRGNFLAVYFSSGVLASFVSLTSFVVRNKFYTSSLGASGAIAGVLAAWCTINSDKYFSFIFLPQNSLPPLSSSILLSILIGIEVAGITRGWHRLDHWAHLGGYLAGWAGAEVLRYRARKRKRQEDQRRAEMGLLERIRAGRL